MSQIKGNENSKTVVFETLTIKSYALILKIKLTLVVVAMPLNIIIITS